MVSYEIVTAATTTTIVTRNSSGDETANVNFLYDDITHVLQSTAPPPPALNCTTRRSYRLCEQEAKRQNITVK